MLRSLARAATGVLLCTALSTAVAVAGADRAAARLTPSVTLTTLISKIDVGEQPTFRYSTSSVPSGSAAVLERYVSGSWTTAAQGPPATNRTIHAPAVTAVGKYTYRMQVKNGGSVLATSGHDHDVYAYRNIALATLCPHTQGNRVCTTVHVTVSGQTYDMHMALGSQVYPNYYTSANFSRTSCRSAALSFATKTGSVTTWLKLVQGSQNHVASTPAHALGHLNVSALTSAQLFFDASVKSSSASVYVDGTMSCWTTTGTY